MKAAKVKRNIAKSGGHRAEINFNGLVAAIQNVHDRLSRQAVKAINVSLTVRNWLIGYYIEEYERHGSDRTKYGDRLMDELACALLAHGWKRCDRRELYRYRQFYLIYPQIWQTLSAKSFPELHLPGRLVIAKVETLSPQTSKNSVVPCLPASKLISSLSFSHFVELLDIDDQLKRTFYEIECIKGNWSVRELKRQITSLYFERCSLSKDKTALSKLTQSVAEADSPRFVIRDPYVFEFLGLRSKDVMHENDLEAALLDKIEDFLLELGRGFCFEARQKRVLIGDDYFFVDLVLYHRILKCHVILELKLDAFKHEYLGQLNTYLNWFKTNEMAPGDNSPIGILLCTEKNHALVKYALADVNNKLFVSKYQLKLPSSKELQSFVEAQLKETKQ